MCIFSSNIVVNSTKILAADLGESLRPDCHLRLLAYQNSIVAETPNVMMLPIPSPTLDVYFHDTTQYAGFLDDLATRIAKEENKRSRGSLTLSKSYQRVGQYQYKMVEGSDVINELIALKQPIQRWTWPMVDAYENWSWLFCIIDAGAEMKNQPLMISYDSFIEPLYFPMMDVHGHEYPKRFTERDQVLIVGEPEFTNPIASGSEFEGFPYPQLKFGGSTIKRPRFDNGDCYANLTSTPDDPRFWEFTMASNFEYEKV